MTTKTKRKQWPSLFGRTEGYRIQGVLSVTGGKEFEKLRAKIARATGRPPEGVSDANVAEYAVRAVLGEEGILPGV